jgi:hypothetical protein
MHQGEWTPRLVSIRKIRELSSYEREVIDGRDDYLSEVGARRGGATPLP